MEYYSRLCSALFQAVSKSGHFKDLKVYYFHNCVYSRLYTEPTLRPSNTVPTDWVLSNLSSEYKVILVGDAQMAPHELVTQFRYRTPDGRSTSAALGVAPDASREYPISCGSIRRPATWGVLDPDL